MSEIFRTYRQGCLLVIILIAVTVGAAFAVPPDQVLRASNLPSLSGPCCFSFVETVAITEPAKPVPVVVTWSAQTGFSFEDEFVGLMVNNGECRFYGANSIPEQGDGLSVHSFVWIIFPTDGLNAGNNTFTLCGGGGGVFGNQSVFRVLDNTLAVRLSN